MSIHLSAVLIVRNEAAVLADCLAALQAFADEIVVVDTGSTDGTPELAARFTDRVFAFAWVDDFAAARNFAIEQARGEWVLSIDADEVVQHADQARALLEVFMAQQAPETVGTVELTSPADGQEVTVHLERFFRRDRFRFTGAIHEQLTAIDGAKRSAPTGLCILHSGYEQQADAPNHKALRNIPLLEKELAAHPKDEYYWYQLGKAQFSLGRFAEAEAAFVRGLECIDFSAAPPTGAQGAVARDVLTGIVVNLAYSRINQNRIPEAQSLLEEHLALAHEGIRRADFYFVLGYAALQAGDLVQARAGFTEALLQGPAREDVRGTGSYSAHYHLGLIREAEYQVPAALEHYALALHTRPDCLPVLRRCVDCVHEYRILLPDAIWRWADHATLHRLYLERLGDLLAQRNAAAAATLIEAAHACDPDLDRRCRNLAGIE
jgi:tetratricopeptide (TPR) repeat protein